MAGQSEPRAATSLAGKTALAEKDALPAAPRSTLFEAFDAWARLEGTLPTPQAQPAPQAPQPARAAVPAQRPASAQMRTQSSKVQPSEVISFDAWAEAEGGLTAGAVTDKVEPAPAPAAVAATREPSPVASSPVVVLPEPAPPPERLADAAEDDLRPVSSASESNLVDPRPAPPVVEPDAAPTTEVEPIKSESVTVAFSSEPLPVPPVATSVVADMASTPVAAPSPSRAAAQSLKTVADERPRVPPPKPKQKAKPQAQSKAKPKTPVRPATAGPGPVASILSTVLAVAGRAFSGLGFGGAKPATAKKKRPTQMARAR